MISFSDHYNALIINRFSSKTKTGKDLWHFNNSLLEKTDFCSNTQNLLTFFLKKGSIIPRQVTGGNSPNAKLKIMLEPSPKTLQNRKTLEFLSSKRDYEIYTKKKTINIKSNL